MNSSFHPLWHLRIHATQRRNSQTLMTASATSFLTAAVLQAFGNQVMWTNGIVTTEYSSIWTTKKENWKRKTKMRFVFLNLNTPCAIFRADLILPMIPFPTILVQEYRVLKLRLQDEQLNNKYNHHRTCTFQKCNQKEIVYSFLRLLRGDPPSPSKARLEPPISSSSSAPRSSSP